MSKLTLWEYMVYYSSCRPRHMMGPLALAVCVVLAHLQNDGLEFSYNGKMEHVVIKYL